MSEILFILFLGAAGFFLNKAAWKRGFFTFPKDEASNPIQVPLTWVLAPFALFVLLNFGLAFLFITLFHPATSLSLNFLQLFISTSTLLAFVLFAKRHPDISLGIIKRSNSPIYADIALGISVWVLAFPVASALGEAADLAMQLFFGPFEYEQVAVRYLKESLDSHLTSALALFSIVILAPCIEEFLFRGCLQNYLKKHLGIKAAILLTALAFSLFHLSPAQGLGNISLVLSLFVFACYLGFLYEKRRSLYASVALHATFNLASSLRLIFGE